MPIRRNIKALHLVASSLLSIDHVNTGVSMAGNMQKNVFISHVHEDDEGLGKLKELLGKHGMEIRDGSINSDKPNDAKSPDYIKQEILAPRINWAGVFLVYISPQTKESEWVDWEIEYAQKQGKRIIGVWEYGESECEVPDALEKFADAVVGWQGERIIDAINGKINGWEKADGTPRQAPALPRYSCN